ncbi:lysozyme [Pseudescherichia sp.]|jgi:lysozyme|uniref:lysozyme n=1 Tax=Pseudescherichia sp. TaxID=2055881 RepID=UPI002899B4BC|nr:lysozyme [Pseudescherichia sp.]MDF2779637.1 Lysozyme [Enterobacteriaceae bacterium]
MTQLIKKAGGAAGIVCSVGMIITMVLNAGHVRTNERGLRLIGNAESCRRDPYLCPAGVLTDGIGNTHNVSAGVQKTDAQIAADWEKNILAAERCVNAWAAGKRLSDNTFSAVTSLTFNVGCGAMQRSTLFRLLRQESVSEACAQFTRWIYAGGVPLAGLKTRRSNEQALCLEGVP